MSDDVRALKDKASQLLGKGKLAPALEIWRQVAAAAPEDVSALQKVGELLARLGKGAEAVQVYEDVAARYAKLGQFFKASAVCRLIVAIEPQHQRTQDLIASLYARSQPAKPVVAAPAAVPVPVEVAAPVEVADEAIEIDISFEAPTTTASGLPAIPLFSALSEDELREILGTAMEVRAYPPNTVLVSEGAPGTSMFALVEGEAGIYRDWGKSTQRRVADLSPGDIFGEVALVSGAPRVATVVASGDAVALEFPREAMDLVIARHARVGQFLEQFYRERLLANALRASPIFRSLPDAEKKALAATFRPGTFTDGQRIIKEGQAVDAVHLLLRGKCVVTHQSGERYPDMKEGDLFGEVSVLTEGPATATVTASGPVLTLRVPAAEFSARVLAHQEARNAVNALAAARLTRTADLDEKRAGGAGPDRRV